MMVIGLSGRLIAYALILVVLILGVRRAYEFGHSIFYSPGMEEEPEQERRWFLTGMKRWLRWEKSWRKPV